MISVIGEFFIVHIVDSAKRLVKYSWLLQVLVERDLKSGIGAALRIFMECFKSASDDDYFNDRFFQYVSLRYTPVPVYLLAGQLIFGFYSEATSMAMGSILGGAALIKKCICLNTSFPCPE